MLQILNVIAPIYLLIGAGYAMTSFGPLKKEDARGLGRFVLNLALPALIIRSLAQNAIMDVFNPTYLAAYFLGTAAAIGSGYLWFKMISRQDPLTSTFNVIGMSCANSGFIGYPILLLILPSIAGTALALNMLVENLLIIPFLIYMAERDRDAGSGVAAMGRTAMTGVLRRLATNPVVIGIVTGLALSLGGLRLPAAIMKSIDLLAVASGAASLVVIGSTLVGTPIKHNSIHILPTVFGKLLIHPLLVWVSIAFVTTAGLPALEPQYSLAAVTMAATPMMGIYTTLAQAYGREDASALNMLVATILSFFTLSGLLWGMGASLTH